MAEAEWGFGVDHYPVVSLKEYIYILHIYIYYIYIIYIYILYIHNINHYPVVLGLITIDYI